MRAIIEATPGAGGILFDLPMVIDTVDADDQPRLTLQAGDFFVDALPSADVTFSWKSCMIGPTSSAMQSWSAIPDAAPDNTTVLVVEGLMPEEQSGPSVSTLDVIMLTMSGGRGRERT